MFGKFYQDCLDIVHNEDKTLEQRGLKLGEEVGEVQAEILRFVQAHGLKYKGKSTVEEIAEEAIDCVIVATSILNHLELKNGLNKEMIGKITEKKLKKWRKILELGEDNGD